MKRRILPASDPVADRSAFPIATTAGLDRQQITLTIASIPDAYAAARRECDPDDLWFKGSRLAEPFRRFEDACAGLIRQYASTVHYIEKGDASAPRPRALHWWIEEYSVAVIELRLACEKFGKQSGQSLDFAAHCLETGQAARHRHANGTVTVYPVREAP